MYYLVLQIEKLEAQRFTAAHSFNSPFMSTYYVQGTMLGLGIKMNVILFPALLKKLLWARAGGAGLQKDAELQAMYLSGLIR